MLGNGLSRCLVLGAIPQVVISGSGLSSGISAMSAASSSTRRGAPNSRRGLHCGAALGGKGGRGPTGSEKSRVESLIGLRRDIHDQYSSCEPQLYQMAVKNFDKKAQVANYVPPFFSAIPAARAAAIFLRQELDLDARELQVEEHFYQQLVSPMPSRSKIHTIVQLADIVDKGEDAMFIIDTATRDDNEVFLTFNQFCYRVNGAGGIGRSSASHRRVQYLENPCQESTPWVWEPIFLSAAQESVFSRLMGEDNPLDGENFEDSSPYVPTKYLGTMGFVAELLMTRFNISIQRLKGIKVLHGPKDVLPEDCLNLAAWKFNKHLIFFNTFNYTPGRSDWVHSGYVTLY